MFDIGNTKLIKDLIDLRKLHKNRIVMPVYVLIGTKAYGLTELNEIDFCSPGMIKIVVGSFNNPFRSYGFPAIDLIKFSNVKKFTEVDEEEQYTTDYVYFETTHIDEPNNPLDEEINMWYDSISKKVMDIVNEKRKERLKNLMEEE